MNFSVHMDDEAVEMLAEIARETGKTRNALVTQAVRDFIERNRRKAWPPSVEAHMRSRLDTSDLASFESYRTELEPPPEPALL
jgi:predicted transcriptional regulator